MPTKYEVGEERGELDWWVVGGLFASSPPLLRVDLALVFVVVAEEDGLTRGKDLFGETKTSRESAQRRNGKRGSKFPESRNISCLTGHRAEMLMYPIQIKFDQNQTKTKTKTITTTTTTATTTCPLAAIMPLSLPLVASRNPLANGLLAIFSLVIWPKI